MEGLDLEKGNMRGRVMAAVAGNSRSKMRDLDRHGECSTQTPMRLRGPCTVDGQSDVTVRGDRLDTGTQFYV